MTDQPCNDGRRIHVYPIDDLREHITEGLGCWCGPTPDAIESRVIVHHSADGRELCERQIT